MASDTNSMVLISLPIVPQDKAFMIEFDMVVEQKEMTVTLNAYWVRNNSLVAHDCSIKKNKFDVYPSAIEKSFKFYYYKGYMCYFFGEECYQINKYSQNLEGANLSIAARNFIIKKITCQTFDVPPEKLHQAIKNLPTDKPVTQEEVLVELMKNE